MVSVRVSRVGFRVRLRSGVEDGARVGDRIRIRIRIRVRLWIWIRVRVRIRVKVTPFDPVCINCAFSM